MGKGHILPPLPPPPHFPVSKVSAAASASVPYAFLSLQLCLSLLLMSLELVGSVAEWLSCWCWGVEVSSVGNPTAHNVNDSFIQLLFESST